MCEDIKFEPSPFLLRTIYTVNGVSYSYENTWDLLSRSGVPYLSFFGAADLAGMYIDVFGNQLEVKVKS